MHYACMYVHTCMHVCTMHCMYYDEPPNYLEFFGCPPRLVAHKNWDDGYIMKQVVRGHAAQGLSELSEGSKRWLWHSGGFLFALIQMPSLQNLKDFFADPPPSHLVFLPTPPPPPPLTPYLFNIGMALLKSNQPFSQLPDQKRTDGDVI